MYYIPPILLVLSSLLIIYRKYDHALSFKGYLRSGNSINYWNSEDVWETKRKSRFSSNCYGYESWNNRASSSKILKKMLIYTNMCKIINIYENIFKFTQVHTTLGNVSLSLSLIHPNISSLKLNTFKPTFVVYWTFLVLVCRAAGPREWLEKLWENTKLWG